MPGPDHDEIRERLRGLSVFDRVERVFDTTAAPEHPADLFWAWLQEAIEDGVCEPHAMTLSTVDGDGRPNARVLILKGLDDGTWQFATNRTSRKGREIAATPWAAATFYWREAGRSVRLRGRVLDAGEQASAEDFLARGPGSRSAAFIGHQGEPLTDPSDLALALAEAEARMRADPQLVAEQWTLYNLVPDEVEFWQADRERRHQRLQYRLSDAVWQRTPLWP